ncbi:MAG TPA: ABC transporter permease [Lentisphaeria bacterium]|nr:MAG: ABC transporter permease [Lentisphaerae bacterium GWF2_50_93]HCE44936.1 ABC transporter permease [Lentisphaeria bacterium]
MIWIEKQRNIIDLALSSLLRKSGKNLALVIIYTAIVFILASVVFFISSLKREAALVLEASPEIVVQKLVAGRQALAPESYIDAMRGLRGTANVRGRLWGHYFDSTVGANYTIMACDDDAQLAAGTITIGRGMARTLSLKKGDSMKFDAYDGTSVDFKVGEILPYRSELVASDLILLRSDGFRRIFGMEEGSYSDVTLQVANRKEMATVAGKIKKLLPDSRPILRDEVLRTYEAIFDWRGGLLIVILCGAVLAFIIFAWDKASGLSFEERREICILKAVGWDTSEVMAMKLWEGAVISLLSFIFGIIGAYLHVFYTSYFLFGPVLKGWSVLYPSYQLIPAVDPYQLAALFFLTVVPYTAATLIPLWGAASIDPDEGMRL